MLGNAGDELSLGIEGVTGGGGRDGRVGGGRGGGRREFLDLGGEELGEGLGEELESLATAPL